AGGGGGAVSAQAARLERRGGGRRQRRRRSDRRGYRRRSRYPGRDYPPAGDAATAACHSRTRRPLIASNGQLSFLNRRTTALHAVIPTAAGVAPRRPWRGRPCDRAIAIALSRERRRGRRRALRNGCSARTAAPTALPS